MRIVLCSTCFLLLVSCAKKTDAEFAQMELFKDYKEVHNINALSNQLSIAEDELIDHQEKIEGLKRSLHKSLLKLIENRLSVVERSIEMFGEDFSGFLLKEREILTELLQSPFPEVHQKAQQILDRILRVITTKAKEPISETRSDYLEE